MRTRLKPEDQRVIDIVSANLRRLMKAMDWSEHDLARESHVSQKAINNLLNKATGCTITTAEKLARPFGLTGWQLMVEDIPADRLFSNTLTLVVQKLLHADPQGREFILSAVKRA